MNEVRLFERLARVIGVGTASSRSTSRRRPHDGRVRRSQAVVNDIFRRVYIALGVLFRLLILYRGSRSGSRGD